MQRQKFDKAIFSRGLTQITPIKQKLKKIRVYPRASAAKFVLLSQKN
jgi:hypothetical protein